MSDNKKRKTRKINLLVRKYINDFPIGDHRSLLRGCGGGFDTARPIQPGDRFVHMPATARTGEIQAKVFQEPKQLTIHTLIDKSHSMAFGSKVTKSEVAEVLSICFERSAAKVGDQFKSTIFGNGVPYSPLKRLVHSGTKHALVVIISDFFFCLGKGELDFIQQLASSPGVTVLSLILYDQQEESHQLHSFLADVCDAEKEELLAWDLSSRSLAQAEAEYLTQWREQIKTDLRQANSEYVMISTTDNFVRELARYFAKKRQYSV